MNTPPTSNENVTKKGAPDCEMGESNEPRSGPSWHQLLLYPSPSSSQLSYISELQTDVGSQPSTPLHQPIRVGAMLGGELDESGTNYDSGNFSLSESGGKEKLTFASAASTGTGDMHQRFVQLNTELYQTKTELLTYKYKWNEIRNEIELSLSKKIDKLLDEKNDVEKELEEVRKELNRLKTQPQNQQGIDQLRIRSELDDVNLELSCKVKANECLKQKIVEQHVEKENLAIQLKALEQQLAEGRSEICGVKSTEKWYREELHRCQNENAKLKESYFCLETLLCKERQEKTVLVEAARKEELRLNQERNNVHRSITSANDESAKETTENESKQHVEGLISEQNASVGRVKDLMERNELIDKQNASLLAVISQLQDSLQQHKHQLETMAKKEKELERYVTHLQQLHESDKSRIDTLTAQLAHECFTKRQIDVSVEKLKAQVKVLSINFSPTICQQRSCAKECVPAQQHTQQDLQDHCNRLIIAEEQLQGEMAMCTEKANQRCDEKQLLENFRSIQSKNLDLELKLGQCVTSKDVDGSAQGIPSCEIVKRSEQTIRSLKQDVDELERKLFKQSAGKGKTTHDKGPKLLCSKHGSRCWEKVSYNGLVSEEEDVEIRNLRIMLKAIESENRRRLKRYELNNRTLLKKAKEHARDQKHTEQRLEELVKEHAKCDALRCEMSSARERCLLMEADLETFKQEAATLRSEKNRLINLVENNCLLTSDGDVWGSLKRAFKELHELRKACKENGRLQDQLERDKEKIKQLEGSITDWKLEFRLQIAEKARQLEETQQQLYQIIEHNTSLEQEASMAELQGKNLMEKLQDLERLVQVQEIRLETANERLKLYEQSDAFIEAAKETFFNDLQSLQEAILLEKQEKYELEEEVRELRQNMVNAVGNSLQNFHPKDTSAEGSGHLSAAVLSPDMQSLSLSVTSLDIDHLRALVEESSQTRYTLQPLHECVSSLKLEMDNLNSVLQIANYPQQQHQQPQQHPQQHHARFPLSLMDELKDATNGRYGSR